jgi:xanthine dehydrogenase D subunit
VTTTGLSTGIPTSTTTGRLGDNARRPDGIAKTRGQFAYASDLHHEGMLVGATLRSPHCHARIIGIDTSAAEALPGVQAVLTARDIPGINLHGLERPDQPVLAADTVRFHGEPVAIVAADHPETARRALELIAVDYDPLEPVLDPWAAALDPCAPRVHPEGNIVRHVPIRRGDLDTARREAEVVVTGEYEVGMQDQAFLGPEAGMAVPLPDGGVELTVATQWVHVDRQQIARALGLPLEQVRVTLGGVGGAFGGREDLTVHAHACLLAMRTGRAVRMTYNRLESFRGHVHRHPARLRYEHGATRAGQLCYVQATVVLDGGPYASCSPEVTFNAATFGIGPYAVPTVVMDAYSVFTHNPVCGAMRGFGAVQVAFAYEAQMDRLAAQLGMDPVELRQRNALDQGATMPTGQHITAPAPVAELLQRVKDLPLPPPADATDVRNLPGAVGNTSKGEGVRRGVGYAVGFKNVAFGEGFDDYSTARVRLERGAIGPLATVLTAAAEVGQGLVTILGQIVREELGDIEVHLGVSDASLGDAGSTSASRQTYMTGGATRLTCEAVRHELSRRANTLMDAETEWELLDGHILSRDGRHQVPIVDLLAAPIDEEREYHHRPTQPLDPRTGQGDANVQYAFCAHRAVVDVDVELGIVKVVALDAAQDVGRALNPLSIEGQIHGGSLQGMGLAVMEELQVVDGVVMNPSFTDYLIPTILDTPTMHVELLEHPDPDAPYGLRGVGEPPTVSSGAAVAAAVRDATGLALTRVPIRVADIALGTAAQVPCTRQPSPTTEGISA